MTSEQQRKDARIRDMPAPRDNPSITGHFFPKLLAWPYRIAITGLGVVSPLGCGVEKNWQALLAGRSGIRPITRFACDDFPTRIAGQVSPQQKLSATSISFAVVSVVGCGACTRNPA
jgi:hypothetical protein